MVLQENKNRNFIRYLHITPEIDNWFEYSINNLDILKTDRQLSYLCDLADYTCDILLQIFTYWILTYDLEYDIKSNILEEISIYLCKFRELLEKKKVPENIDLKDAVTIFIAFLKFRNKSGEYIKIIHTLNEEQESEADLFCIPEAKYKVEKNELVDESKWKDIITEGSNVDEYAKKLEISKKLIEIFSKFGGRNASVENLLDVKVYFREIYISDSKYKVTAKTIARKYFEAFYESGQIDSFRTISEESFLREKISRGYYREYGFLELYNKREHLQVILYETVIDILLLYNYEDSIDTFKLLIIELIAITLKHNHDLYEYLI